VTAAALLGFRATCLGIQQPTASTSAVVMAEPLAEWAEEHRAVGWSEGGIWLRLVAVLSLLRHCGAVLPQVMSRQLVRWLSSPMSPARRAIHWIGAKLIYAWAVGFELLGGNQRNKALGWNR
jgi:hypothetical protein